MTGIETLFGAAIAGISKIITDTVVEYGKGFLKEHDIDLFQKKVIEKATAKYIERYISENGKLKVTCAQMDEPVDLENIYTSVRFLDRTDLNYIESIDTFEELTKRSLNKGFEGPDHKKRKGIDIANEYPYLMVLGGPGVGKSTFLKKIGLEALKGDEGEYKHDCIPVLIELRQFNPTEMTLEGKVSQELRNCGFPKDYELAGMALEKGNLLLLIDGIDEIPPIYEKQTITYIENFIRRYYKNRFILSCRLAAYIGGFTHFKDVVMASFDDTQIKDYMTRWFSSDKDREAQTAQKCWELINTREYQSAKELAQTPLLLTLLCVVYDQSLNFSKNRALLYGEALDVFLKKWSAEKRLERKSIYKEFNPDLEQILLSEMAIRSLSSNKLLFDKNEAKDNIKSFLVSNLNAPQSVDIEEIIKAIEVQQGIFVERTKDTYSFSHLTLQEYLAAQYIVDNKRENDLIARCLFNERWREVFLLSIGLMKGARSAEEFLLKICHSISRCYEYEKINEIIKFAERVTQFEDASHNAIARRASAIYMLRLIQAICNMDFDFISLKDGICIRSLYVSSALNLPPNPEDFRTFSYILDAPFDFIRLICRIPNYVRREDGKISKFINYSDGQSPINAIRRMHTLSTFGNSGIFDPSCIRSVIKAMEEFSSSSQQSLEHLNTSSFSREIARSYIESFNIDESLLELSRQEILILMKLLYGVELVIRCKESAVRISPKVWESISSQLLKSPH